MKKEYYLLSAFLFIFNFTSTYAQEKGDLSIGFKGGLSIPNLSSGETANDWTRDYTSIEAGFFSVLANYQFSKYFSFQPELAYSGEGGQRKSIQPISIPDEYIPAFQAAFNNDKDYLYANLHNVAKMHYLLLPLNIKFEYPLALNHRLNFFAQVGPNIGYLLSAKQEVESENLRVFLDSEAQAEIPEILVHSFFGSSIDTTFNSVNELHRWNVGVQGGVGFSYNTAKGKIFIEGGGNYGFLPVQKADNRGKNNVGAANLLVGYMYRFRG